MVFWVDERERVGSISTRERNKRGENERKKKFLAFIRESCNVVRFKARVRVLRPNPDPPHASLAGRPTRMVLIDFPGSVDPSFDPCGFLDLATAVGPFVFFIS